MTTRSIKIAPSISIWIGRSPIIARRLRTFSTIAGMKLWPPKPGLTVITQTRSSRSSTCSIAASGVPGFSAAPALQPRSRIICAVRSKCGPASGWAVSTSAPASANALR